MVPKESHDANTIGQQLILEKLNDITNALQNPKPARILPLPQLLITGLPETLYELLLDPALRTTSNSE